MEELGRGSTHGTAKQARGEGDVWTCVGGSVKQRAAGALVAPQELRVRRGFVEQREVD